MGTFRHAELGMTSVAMGDLGKRVAGPVLRPGDEDYAGELAGFDLAVDQRPAIVVGATGPADVIAAVRYACEAGLAVGVQATGHGITVPANNALLITTHRADGVRVDPADRSAWIEAGAIGIGCYTRPRRSAKRRWRARRPESAPCPTHSAAASASSAGGGVSPPIGCAGSTSSPPTANRGG